MTLAMRAAMTTPKIGAKVLLEKIREKQRRDQGQAKAARATEPVMLLNHMVSYDRDHKIHESVRARFGGNFGTQPKTVSMGRSHK